MLTKNNKSKSSRQAVNKNNSSKVSKLHQYRLNICKLKYGRTYAIGDWMYWQILRYGSISISMKDLSKIVDLTERNTREAVNALVDFGALKKKRGVQSYNSKYNGPSTFYLGHACFETEKLKILSEQMPMIYHLIPLVIEAQKEGWKRGQKLSTKGGARRLVINKIRGGALRSNLNNNPYCSLSLYLTSELDNDKEYAGANEKVHAKKVETFLETPVKISSENKPLFLSNPFQEKKQPERSYSVEPQVSRAIETLNKELSRLKPSELDPWRIRKAKAAPGTIAYQIYAGIDFL